MREAEQIVRGLLDEDEPSEFIDRQADLLLLAALLRNKWRMGQVIGNTRTFVKDHGETNGFDERIILYLDRLEDGSVSVTASGEVNYADEFTPGGVDWHDFEKEIDKEWILKPGDNVDEFVEGLADDLCDYRSEGEPPTNEPDYDDQDD